MSAGNDEEKIVIGHDYGFKANIRQSTWELIYALEWLRKFGLFYSITIGRIIASILVLLVIISVFCVYLFTSYLRLKYLGLPLLLMSVSLMLILSQYAFINPSFGSFLSIGKSMSKQLKESKAKKKGKAIDDQIDIIKDVREDGVIITKNGYARLLEIDGSTSLNAFPSEVRDQENRAHRYQHNRERSTVEIEITSSQRQNATNQIKTAQHLIRMNTHPAIIENQEQEEYHLQTKVNGKKETVVQYKMVEEKSERGLDLAMENIYLYEAEGYYYSVRELTEKETREILTDIFFLK